MGLFMTSPLQHEQVPLSEEEQQKQQDAPDKMAIGVEGGFQVGGPAGGDLGSCWGSGLQPLSCQLCPSCKLGTKP